MLFHFGYDPQTHTMGHQFMLGADVIVAPVLDRGAQSGECLRLFMHEAGLTRLRAAVRMYVPPEATWRDAWTNAVVGGGWSQREAPLGRPCVVFRDGWKYQQPFREGISRI